MMGMILSTMVWPYGWFGRHFGPLALIPDSYCVQACITQWIALDYKVHSWNQLGRMRNHRMLSIAFRIDLLVQYQAPIFQIISVGKLSFSSKEVEISDRLSFNPTRELSWVIATSRYPLCSIHGPSGVLIIIYFTTWDERHSRNLVLKGNHNNLHNKMMVDSVQFAQDKHVACTDSVSTSIHQLNFRSSGVPTADHRGACSGHVHKISTQTCKAHYVVKLEFQNLSHQVSRCV